MPSGFLSLENYRDTSPSIVNAHKILGTSTSSYDGAMYFKNSALTFAGLGLLTASRAQNTQTANGLINLVGGFKGGISWGGSLLGFVQLASARAPLRRVQQFGLEHRKVSTAGHRLRYQSSVHRVCSFCR